MRMTAGNRRKRVRSWSDDLVAEILNANSLMECAALGVPGFDALQELTARWQQAKTGYAIAVNERWPVTRKRARLRRLAARVHATPIDWKATAEARRSGSVTAVASTSNVIDLAEATKNRTPAGRRA